MDEFGSSASQLTYNTAGSEVALHPGFGDGGACSYALKYGGACARCREAASNDPYCYCVDAQLGGASIDFSTFPQAICVALSDTARLVTPAVELTDFDDIFVSRGYFDARLFTGRGADVVVFERGSVQPRTTANSAAEVTNYYGALTMIVRSGAVARRLTAESTDDDDDDDSAANVVRVLVERNAFMGEINVVPDDDDASPLILVSGQVEGVELTAGALYLDSCAMIRDTLLLTRAVHTVFTASYSYVHSMSTQNIFSDQAAFTVRWGAQLDSTNGIVFTTFKAVDFTLYSHLHLFDLELTVGV